MTADGGSPINLSEGEAQIGAPILPEPKGPEFRHRMPENLRTVTPKDIGPIWEVRPVSTNGR